MALSPKLELKQSQSLVMTPQLMQAIKLLQLGNLDLVAYVEGELERNPLLERDDEERRAGDRDSPDREPAEGADRPAPAADTAEFDAEGGAPAAEGPDVGEPGFEAASAMTDKLDTDLSNDFPDEPAERQLDAGLLAGDSWQSGGSRGGGADDDYNLEAFVAAETSLADHLSEQLALAVADPARRLVGQYLIDAVDESGYLRTDLESVAEKLGCPVAMVQEVLDVLQRFDPAGVCARDLKECLALQLKERDRYDPCMARLIENLELLARRDFAALRRICGCDDEDLADMVAEVKALNPKPGNAFGGGVVQPVVPDVLVRPAPDGGWLVELNTETLPKVLVNQTYYATVTKVAKGDKDKAYLADCLQSANWLVKSLDQRAKTILKVASEIVRQQDAFLAYGVQHLRPLNLRMIADAIGMHESTVSRVTSNKYMATTRGIFEFKYFFTSSIASSEGGEAHSSESVRYRIKEMIDAERADDVLSDDTIVKQLKDAGIDIARRTVAKYREALNIPSSVQRRREKQALGG
ncbi:RNA polymerase factor sigma-54 [Prosthecomicrobium sp. N25]|uniref:RNA polymerase factor sigma-54 n=1 Tax=Prosthecomicrobium sp. N25 TaxID=3129254 RepID=UPI003077549C